MKLTLFDMNAKVRNAWSSPFSDVPVEITCDDFRTLTADAIVSPANSFGFMDGGIDLAYSEYFGRDVQKSVQEFIHQTQLREVLVGQATAVPTGNDRIPYLICAPTMRIPSTITDSVDVYLATRAALMVARMQGWSVLMPGMGTGVGGVEPGEAARRMRQAYDHVMQDHLPKFETLGDAMREHRGY